VMVLPTRRAVVLAGAVMVRAQESNRTFRLGMLVGVPRQEPQFIAFFDELYKAGFIEGKNLTVDFGVQGSSEQNASSVAELMQPAPDVLVTGAPTIAEVQAVTRTVPILGVFDDMVAIGLWRARGLFGGIGGKDRYAIEAAIAAVGLTGFEGRTIGTLSGGQMQRMLFARLLVQDARVIVLDEPFTAVDARTSADLLELVRRWHAERRIVLAALHDIDLVGAAFPETLLLAREPVAWGSTREVLTPENLNRARRMCEAFDESAEACVVAAE